MGVETTPVETTPFVETTLSYAFVGDGSTCEDNGFETIATVEDCYAAGVELGYVNQDEDGMVDESSISSDRPQGCTWHDWGNLEFWPTGSLEGCTEMGYAGCLCYCDGVLSGCCDYISEYGLQPYISWGGTPESEKEWWQNNDCNNVVGGSSDATNCPYQCGNQYQTCGERQNGFCLTSDSQDQNSGVIQADGDDWDETTCLAWCESQEFKTGCELILETSECYLHTQDVSHGNGWLNHYCWICDSGCETSEEVFTIGSSSSNSKTISIVGSGDYTCPTEVNKDNWYNPAQYGDQFSVSQDGDTITTTRTDSNAQTGWGLNLKIICYCM